MTSLDILLDKAPQVRRWLSDPITKLFLGWLAVVRESPDRALGEAYDPYVLYRAQGERAMIDRILELEKQVATRLKNDGGKK